jgi:hypothetical protein
MKEKLRIRTELLASDGDGIDPCGWYVYLLWVVRDDDKPVYVGSSGNILARLGAPSRRQREAIPGGVGDADPLHVGEGDAAARG